MRVPSVGRRRRLAAVAVIAPCAVTLLVHARTPVAVERPEPRPVAAGLDDTGYVALSDRLQRRLDALWNPRLRRYDPGPGAAFTEVNADLLLVHSVAALRDHDGATRDDARARAIARLLVGPQLWAERPPAGADPQVTGPGWVSGPGRFNRHPVFDAAVIDGLVHAYRAREAIGLDRDTVERIRYEIHRVATSQDYRWPALRLNQINWYCQMFAADAIVNGERTALVEGMERHLAGFLSGAAGTEARAGNLGAGLRFHYLPHRPLRARANVDSAEYANIVLSVSRFYGLARRAGMRPPARLDLLRDWVRRVLAGYWTHSGSLNWDTGLGFNRWHQRKKFGLAQLALIGVAAQPELQPDPEWGAWAKWMLDRGLTSYAALVDRERRIPAPLAYGVHEVPEVPSNAYLAAARVQSNAMRALEAGLGRRPAQRPPALYSYDPDTGRLAVTTPAYNTAIVAVNQHTIPYGGLDIARLLDSDQEVAANVGGSGAAAFGLTARAGRRVVLATQYGDRAYAPGVTPLRLTRAPLGAGATSGLRAYAAPFTDLHATGSVRVVGMRATAAYRFTPEWIEGRWSLRSRTKVDAAITFPSWGRGARVLAVLRDGRTVALTRSPLADVRSLQVVSERSGYRVRLSAPAGATVRIAMPSPQPADPSPGPTAELSLASTRRASFTARIVPDAKVGRR